MDDFQLALDAALRFIACRPRSEHEIRRRLGRKAALPAATIEAVLTRLRAAHLVDDAAFARYWVDQRQTFRPRGPRLLRAELRQRGVSGGLAASASEAASTTAEHDAYRAGRRKAAQLWAQQLDERAFRTRLGQFLARRGFDWDTIQPTVSRLWREAQRAA